MGVIGGPHRNRGPHRYRIPFESDKYEDRSCKVIYRCEYMMGDAFMFIEGDSIARFKDGFWLNEDYEFTLGDDAKYWMPPSSIIRVTKELKKVH